MTIFSQNGHAARRKYINNPGLPCIKSGFKGNEIIGDVFQNLYGKSGGSSLWQVLKWRFSKNVQKKVKVEESYSLPVIPAQNTLQDNDDYILWLGHASWLIQVGGKKIVTDPCLTAPPFVKRLTRLPIPIEDIKPDCLLISHGHYDHLDTDTLEHFGGASALIPLNMTRLIKKINPDIKCYEAGWYQPYENTEDFQVIFLPAHHWHRRNSHDYNEVLWGSFLIKTKTTSIYFGGDSGYSNHFKDIGELFGGIDTAILPIAAYAPRWFMKASHINPEEAMQACKDLKVKRFIPMHYGTFDLSDEPLGEPEHRLKNISRQQAVTFLTIGEKYLLNKSIF
ncbi:MAG: MBL fold metallo-hydrolase [Thermodesulfobacteriota bacterium]|nr:MBL fold metallo-hydrolase [Thermodesulfobacteriota bacterium]